jgi:hypothetical protein
MLPAVLLVVFGGYVYSTGTKASSRGRTAEQIPEWRRSVADATTGKRPMSQEKALEITKKAIDVIESQTLAADTAVEFTTSVGACILLLGAAQAAAVIYVVRRSRVKPAA